MELVAASAEGGTIAEAAAGRVRVRAREATRVAELSGLIGTLLDADLADATAEVIRALNDRAAVSADVFDLMEALPPLAELARYGSVRSSDTEPVLAVVRGLVPRAAAGLVAACQSLDDDAASAAKARIVAVSGAVALIEEPELKAVWGRRCGRWPIRSMSTAASSAAPCACCSTSAPSRRGSRRAPAPRPVAGLRRRSGRRLDRGVSGG